MDKIRAIRNVCGNVIAILMGGLSIFKGLGLYECGGLIGIGLDIMLILLIMLAVLVVANLILLAFKNILQCGINILKKNNFSV